MGSAGNAITAPGTVVVQAPDGAVVYEGDIISYGTRLVDEAAGPEATPAL